MSSPRKKGLICCRVANAVLRCLLDATGLGHPKRCDLEVAIETIVLIEECTEDGSIDDLTLGVLADQADRMRESVRRRLQKGHVDDAIDQAKNRTDEMRETAIAGLTTETKTAG